MSVLPDVGSELMLPWSVVGVSVRQSCVRTDSEEALPVLQDERSVMSFFSPAGCRSNQSGFLCPMMIVVMIDSHQ